MKKNILRFTDIHKATEQENDIARNNPGCDGPNW